MKRCSRCGADWESYNLTIIRKEPNAVLAVQLINKCPRCSAKFEPLLKREKITMNELKDLKELPNYKLEVKL